jgi:hypothetical protein
VKEFLKLFDKIDNPDTIFSDRLKAVDEVVSLYVRTFRVESSKTDELKQVEQIRFEDRELFTTFYDDDDLD